MTIRNWFAALLLRPTTKEPRTLAWDGDGSFSFDIVGEVSYQDALDAIAGGKSVESCDLECVAILMAEPANPHDKHAVAVAINGKIVGYLSRAINRQYIEHLRLNGDPGQAFAGCRAKIVGGWHRGDDEGFYGVKLDMIWPPQKMPGA